ncbi:MAG: putative beta-lysine N-acetyltransferase [Desulfobacteraceae bacterium]
MSDIIEKLHGSTIHHGPFNNRIFLLKLSAGDCPGILSELDEMAKERGYTKIIAKVPGGMADDFIRKGYHSEARIKGYFRGGTSDPDVLFMVKYRGTQRAVDTDEEGTQSVLDRAVAERRAGVPARPPSSYVCRPADKSDTSKMAELYRKVFPTYPFPIDDPGFLAQTMDNDCRYMGVWKEGQLVSLASADMDVTEKNAEMTDFATHPDHKGRRFAGLLLNRLETVIADEGIKTAYTIARTRSFGMNITFSRAGYCFAGTLVNNTNISGNIESMNVWYKSLSKKPVIAGGK